jgi:hypothetical protein
MPLVLSAKITGKTVMRSRISGAGAERRTATPPAQLAARSETEEQEDRETGAERRQLRGANRLASSRRGRDRGGHDANERAGARRQRRYVAHQLSNDERPG